MAEVQGGQASPASPRKNRGCAESWTNAQQVPSGWPRHSSPTKVVRPRRHRRTRSSALAPQPQRNAPIRGPSKHEGRRNFLSTPHQIGENSGEGVGMGDNLDVVLLELGTEQFRGTRCGAPAMGRAREDGRAPPASPPEASAVRCSHASPACHPRRGEERIC